MIDGAITLHVLTTDCRITAHPGSMLHGELVDLLEGRYKAEDLATSQWIDERPSPLDAGTPPEKGATHD